MALRFIDGFDHYVAADFTDKWTTNTGASISAGNGRNTTASLRITGAGSYLTKTLDAQATWIVGFSMKTAAFQASGSAIFQLLDVGTVQCGLYVNADGTLSVVRGTSTAVTGGTSALSLSLNTVYYIEFKVTIADSIGAGTCKARVNGVDWVTVTTGQDLKATANATANQVRLGVINSSMGNVDFDDFYCCDGTGSVNNDFLGDVMISTLFPNGAGNSTQWTPSTGSNYQNVDETAPDDDTTYNSSATAGHVDLYTLTDLSATPASIKGIQWNAQVRKDDASAYVLNRSVRSAGTTYHGSTSLAPNTTYVNYAEILETDPATSAAWTGSGVNALEAGIKLVSIV